MGTTGLSEALFEKGAACGGCYEIRCVSELKFCLPGTSIVVTTTNFCAPNYGLPGEAGGVCNPPNHHLLLPIQAFEKIAMEGRCHADSVPKVFFKCYIVFLI